MASAFRHGFTALCFLTRLGRGRMIAEEDFGPSLVWFPCVGLLVGALAVLPAWLGLFGGHPLLQGWLIAGISLWLTRGLHYDGWADLWDGWGSAAKGERFWEIVKDSRAGPFGVMGLVMGLGGQVLAFAALAGIAAGGWIEAGHSGGGHMGAVADGLSQSAAWGAIIWCFVVGRLACMASLCLSKARVRPGLAGMFAPGATPQALTLSLVQTILLGLLLTTPGTVLAGLTLTGLGLYGLVGFSRRVEGFNGDFMGTAVILGELCAALAALL